MAPRAGVLVYRVESGCSVHVGDTVAELVDVTTGTTEPLRARASGVLYTPLAARWAAPGQRVAKIAGTTPARTVAAGDQNRHLQRGQSWSTVGAVRGDRGLTSAHRRPCIQGQAQHTVRERRIAQLG